MPQLQRVGNHATSIFTEDGFTKIVYHTTVVVKFNYDTIVLNSGGWETATTKVRMNQASSQYNLGFTVLQKDFEWFISYNGKVIDFHDNIELKR